jgi:hypothetical protein
VHSEYNGLTTIIPSPLLTLIETTNECTAYNSHTKTACDLAEGASVAITLHASIPRCRDRCCTFVGDETVNCLLSRRWSSVHGVGVSYFACRTASQRCPPCLLDLAPTPMYRASTCTATSSVRTSDLLEQQPRTAHLLLLVAGTSPALMTLNLSNIDDFRCSQVNPPATATWVHAGSLFHQLASHA